MRPATPKPKQLTYKGRRKCPACTVMVTARGLRQHFRAHDIQYDAWLSERRKHNSRRSGIKAHFGLEAEQHDECYVALWLAQGGAISGAAHCAICARPGRTLSLDHDHETLLPRGLICVGCNTALGQLGDTCTDVARAFAYLVRASSSGHVTPIVVD